MSRTFTANYDGFCNCCDRAIYAGDEIGYVDDEIACEDCCGMYA